VVLEEAVCEGVEMVEGEIGSLGGGIGDVGGVEVEGWRGGAENGGEEGGEGEEVVQNHLEGGRKGGCVADVGRMWYDMRGEERCGYLH